jgi:hypothetical protein
VVAAGRGTRLPDGAEEPIEDEAERQALMDKGKRIALTALGVSAVLTAAFYLLPI